MRLGCHLATIVFTRMSDFAHRSNAARQVLWAAIWLAVVLVSIKGLLSGRTRAARLWRYWGVSAFARGDFLRRRALRDRGVARRARGAGACRRAPARGTRHHGRLLHIGRVLVHLRPRQRRRLRGVRRIPHLSAARADRRRADAQFVGRRVPDTRSRRWTHRAATCVRRARARDGPRRAATRRVMASARRCRRCVARSLARPRTSCVFHGMGDQAGSTDRRQPAVGACLVVVGGHQRKKHGSHRRSISAGRSRRLRAPGDAARTVTGGGPSPCRHAGTTGQRKPSSDRSM